MSDIRAILFDFDDTLQDRAQAYAQYCAQFMEEFFPELDPEQREERIFQMEEEVEGGYINRTVYFQKLIALWRWEDAPETDDLSAHYNREFGKHTAVFYNAVPVLQELRNRGYRLGIVSNGPSVLQNTKLDTSGLRPLMDVCLVSGDYDRHKPDRGLFDLAAQKMKVKNEQCVFVGDHPTNDIAGALGAGMQAIWMNYGTFAGQKPEGVPEISDLNELLESFPPRGKGETCGREKEKS